MRLAERMTRLGTETAFEVLAKARLLEAEGMDVVHLEIGETRLRLAHPTSWRLARTRLTTVSPTTAPLPDSLISGTGLPRRYRDTRGVHVTGDNVVVTPGGKPIMFFLIMALVDEGDEVLYPNPGFPIYESMINFVGGVPAPMQLHESRDFNIDIDEIEGKITDRTRS